MTAASRLVSAVVVLAAAACGSGAAEKGPSLATFHHAAREATASGLIAQARVLRDGEITPIEYRRSVARAVQCIRAHGYGATEASLSPVDGRTLVYDQDPNGHPMGTFDEDTIRCNLDELSFVAPLYLDTHPARMAAPLQRATTRCLRRSGMRVDEPQSSVGAFLEVLGADRKDALVACVTSQAAALYPDLRQIVVAF